MANVFFKKITQAQFEALATKDSGTFYRVQLTDNSGEDFYLGSMKLNNSADITAAINALDTSSNVVIASETDSVVTLTKAVYEENGIIKPVTGDGSTVTLSKVAVTGKAEDVSIATTSQVYDATNVKNVEQAIDALAEQISSGNTSSQIYVKSTDGANNSGILKAYAIYQGVDPDVETDDSKLAAGLVTTINIPKDFFVKSGKVVSVTQNGSDFVDSDSAVCDSTVTKEGQYLKFVINTSDASETGSVIWIAADSLLVDLDTTADVTIASVTGDIVTLKAGISQTNGLIGQGSGADITLAKVAKTGASGDVSYDNTTSGLTSSNVKSAIDEVVGTSTDTSSSSSIVGAKKYADALLTWEEVV